VSAVGASGTIPFLETAGQSLSRFVIQGRQVEHGHDAPRATVLFASDDYFRAMDIPLVSGRFFTRGDTLGQPLVAIVNRSLAERYWPDVDPVGQQISGDGVEWHTIVGVVENVRQQLSLDPMDEIYGPMGQMPYMTSNWAIRSTRDLNELGPLVRAAVHRVEPDQPIYRMLPLTELRAASLAPPRLTAALLGIFALLALVITATGIAGVIAFSVTQRTQEFGVRVALGANRRDVVSMVVVEGLRLALTGLAIGAAAALLLSGGLATMLFRIEPTDTVTYVVVSSVLLLVAGAACLLPALRAASVNPLDALRAS
jgi:predicted permease